MIYQNREWWLKWPPGAVFGQTGLEVRWFSLHKHMHAVHSYGVHPAMNDHLESQDAHRCEQSQATSAEQGCKKYDAGFRVDIHGLLELTKT